MVTITIIISISSTMAIFTLKFNVVLCYNQNETVLYAYALDYLVC